MTITKIAYGTNSSGLAMMLIVGSTMNMKKKIKRLIRLYFAFFFFRVDIRIRFRIHMVKV